MQKLKIKKQNKGQFVSDVNANRNYVKIAREEGWVEIAVPHKVSHKETPDLSIATKYTKGIHPIFTADKLAYTLTEKELANSGYIIHKVPNKKDEERYEEQIRKYFQQYSEKNTHQTKWTIELEGKPTKIKLKKHSKIK